MLFFKLLFLVLFIPATAFGGTVQGDSDSSGSLDIAKGGTNAGTAADARTNLGLAIGTDIEAYDADKITSVLDDTTGAVDILSQIPATFTNGDTTPDVSAQTVYRTANTSSTWYTNFDNPTDGQWVYVHVNDAFTRFDFTSSNLEGIASDVNAIQGEMYKFHYDSVDSNWHVQVSPEAIETLATNGVVVNSSGTPLTVSNAVKSANYTIGVDSAAECYGGHIFADTNSTTITACDNLADGMNFCVSTKGAVAVHCDVQSDDLMYLDGTALADGDKATNTSTTGDIICCDYYNSTGWWCLSGSPDGDHWTDGN